MVMPVYLLVILFLGACLFALFFRFQALKGGMPLKRWTAAGFIFGPLLWPMFTMNKRVSVYKKHGICKIALRA